MNVIERIKQQLETYPIVLYMKGTPVFPQCGFSAKVSALLAKCLKEAAAPATTV